MGRNAFDTAVEVVADGFTGEAGLAEWMRRIDQLGQRYCALAIDVIFVGAQGGDEAAAQPLADPGGFGESFDPLFEGQFSWSDVPGEPVEY